jgi:hypothetical protein
MRHLVGQHDSHLTLGGAVDPWKLVARCAIIAVAR